jgi:hypothetical protein
MDEYEGVSKKDGSELMEVLSSHFPGGTEEIYSWYSGWDSNPVSPEYESRALPLR